MLPRGNWLDESGPIVAPERAGFAAGSAIKEPPSASRLDLAGWLVARDNPLVARVMVNRLWTLAFGQGLVATPDDFGSQGAWPTHPELLDWLASEFVDSGWNVKAMLRLMVMSQTYRQLPPRSQETGADDPANRWLAHRTGSGSTPSSFATMRLGRSAACSLTEIGGPSVKPYQPPGYWIFLNFPERDYVADQRRKPVSPRPLHLLATHLSASQPAGLRRLDARGVRGRPPTLEHPLAGPGAPERPLLRRGRAGPCGPSDSRRRV